MRLAIGFFLFVLGFYSFVLFSNDACAAPLISKMCVKNSDGTLRITTNRRCPPGFTRITNYAMLQGGSGATGPQGPSNLVGVAHVDVNGTLVGHVMGGTTTGMGAERPSDGHYVVTFTGTFPGLTETDSLSNQDKVLINATAYGVNYAVSNAYLVSATSTEIKVGFYTWRSDGISEANIAGGYVTVFLSD
jgi:hypothetical protein